MICDTRGNRSGVGCDPDTLLVVHRSLLLYSLQWILPRRARRGIRFAAGVANIPPGGTGTVSLKLTKQGKRLLRMTKKRRLKGVLGIREITATATVSNTPLTLSRTDVTVRLKRRK